MDELTQGDADFADLARQSMNRGGELPPPASFSVEATYDEAKSKAKGHPVYVDTDIVEIRVGRDTIRRAVTEADKRTYAAQYKAWKASESQEAVEGFPLGQWAAIPGKAIVKEFAHYGIRTVEQLAAATDSTIHLVGPHLNLRQQARDWVAEATKQAPLLKLRAENDELKNRLSAVEKMLARQTQEIEAARQNGGALPAAPSPAENGRLEALERQIQALIASREPAKVILPPGITSTAGTIRLEGDVIVSGTPQKTNKDGTPRKKPGPKPKVTEN